MASNFLLLQALDLPGYFVNEYTIFVTGFVTWLAFGALLGAAIGMFSVIRAMRCFQKNQFGGAR